MSQKLPFRCGIALGAAMALGLPTGALAQGAGASVDWSLDTDGATVVVYDAPENFDKHYRICFQEMPRNGKLVVVMADRSLTMTRESCVDVVSNKISLTLQGSNEEVMGIVYLVE